MQSGITASPDLLTAFNALVSSPSSRALLATITAEQLTPTTTLPTTASPDPSDFTHDLPSLQPYLPPNAAVYILLKLPPSRPDGFAAISYIPLSAPVRQKMLFASTRLTLARELGLERFSVQRVVGEREELTAEGWRAWEVSEGLDAPLTESEKGERGVREAEARESGGTTARGGGVFGGGAGRVEVPTGEGVVRALSALGEGGRRLVVLGLELPEGRLVLVEACEGVEAEAVAGKLSTTAPRFAFWARHGTGEVVFVYCCPGRSKVRERMVYSTSKSWVRIVAERDAGVLVGRSVECTEPGELDLEASRAEGGGDVAGGDAGSGVSGESKPSFARPKRPGRR